MIYIFWKDYKINKNWNQIFENDHITIYVPWRVIQKHPTRKKSIAEHFCSGSILPLLIKLEISELVLSEFEYDILS